MLRKINAVISLFITVLLMTHAINNAVWMLSMGRFILSINKLSWVLFCLMMVHAIISIALAILGHKGAEKRKCNGYPNLNKLQKSIKNIFLRGAQRRYLAKVFVP